MEILSLLWQKRREPGTLDGMLQTKRQTLSSWESRMCERYAVGAGKWSPVSGENPERTAFV